MSVPTLGVWLEFASTYSYLAASRVEELASKAGVAVAWRPFLLLPIFRRQGWEDSPFNLYAAKGRSMWRDMERLCADAGLPFARPSAFPRNGLMAARVATAIADEAWCGDYVRAVYRANFGEDREIGALATQTEILEELGQPAAEILDAAHAQPNKDALRRRTEEATERGLFGAPSFTTDDGELFWGNDRLEEALRWLSRPA